MVCIACRWGYQRIASPPAVWRFRNPSLEVSFWGAIAEDARLQFDYYAISSSGFVGNACGGVRIKTVIPHQAYKRFLTCRDMPVHIHASVSVLMVAISNPSSCLAARARTRGVAPPTALCAVSQDCLNLILPFTQSKVT